jgi:two-component system KDP operon response regulator KdpE
MKKSAKVVLLIEDDPKIRRFVRAGFELSGYTVLEAGSAMAGLKSVMSNPSDLIILDLFLPDLHGQEVLETVRLRSNVPVIILSVIASEGEKVRLLQAGADDYVVKPFGMPELLARSEAALRRCFKTETESHIVVAGPLSVDLAARVVNVNAKTIELTRKEYSLLHILALHVGLAVSYEYLIDKIWPNSHRDNIHDLRHLVRNLREKIELNPNELRLIVTESGVGYRLQQQFGTSKAGFLRPRPF